MAREIERLAILIGAASVVLTIWGHRAAFSDNLVILSMIFGGAIGGFEYIRMQEVPLIFGSFLSIMVLLVSGEQIVACCLFAPFLLISAWLSLSYGSFDFKHIKTTGKYKVAFHDRVFMDGKRKIPCLVFYPTAESETDLIPYLSYGSRSITGMKTAFSFCLGNGFLGWLVSKMNAPFLHVQLNVKVDGKPALSEMQLIVFSHGLTNHRNAFSMIMRELASHGFAVIAPTHGDGSADFHPDQGEFQTDFPVWDYETHNR